jgi:hypothetical protein
MAHEHKGVECWKTHRDGGRNFHQQPTWFIRMRNTDLDDGRDEVKDTKMFTRIRILWVALDSGKERGKMLVL